MTTKPPSPQSPASGFSLAALMFLIASVAVLLAVSIPATQALAQRHVGVLGFLYASLGAGLFCGILGAMIGLFHYRRWRGFGWGSLTGTVIGLAVGPLAWSQDYQQIVMTCLGGSLLLLVLAGLLRALDRTG